MTPTDDRLDALERRVETLTAAMEHLTSAVDGLLVIARLRGVEFVPPAADPLPAAQKPGAVDTDSVMRAVIAAPISAGRIHYDECPASRDTTFGPCTCSMRSSEWVRQQAAANDDTTTK